MCYTTFDAWVFLSFRSYFLIILWSQKWIGSLWIVHSQTLIQCLEHSMFLGGKMCLEQQAGKIVYILNMNEWMHRDAKLHPSITKSRTELNAMSLHTACFVINAEIFVKSTKRICGRKQKDSSTSYFLSSEIVSLAYNNPLVYIGTFPTFQIKCHVRNILYIKRTTSMVSRAICKYYLINSTKVDRLKTLHLCSRWERPRECVCVLGECQLALC